MLTPEIIQALAGAQDYTLLAKENSSLLLLFFPYQPFCTFPQGHLTIDAYYITSNRSYHAAKATCAALTDQGYAAALTNDFNFKKALVDNGKCIMGHNGLSVHPRFGSYFVLQAIEISPALPTMKQNDSESVRISLCGNCSLCHKSCPTNALSGETPDYSRCIRSLQEHPVKAADFSYFGQALLGCPVCRRICPYNAHIPCIEPTEEILCISQLDRLLLFDAQTERELQNLLGKNIAKKKLLLPSILSAAVAQKHPALPKALTIWRNHPSPAVAQSAHAAENAIANFADQAEMFFNNFT